MSLYLDTSALAKLVVSETESGALRSWLGARPGQSLVTNIVGVVELQRLAGRISSEASSAATLLLARIDQLALTSSAIAAAGRLPPPEVRTLDAFHIASAAELSDIEALVTYDRRMIEAASRYGLAVESPIA